MTGQPTITLPQALYDAVRRAAEAMGVTPDEWVAEVLRAQLTHPRPESAAVVAHRDVARVAPTLEQDAAASPSLAPEVDTV
jgi:hypothetical protein